MGNIEFFTSKRDRDKRHESTQTSSPSTRSPPGNSDQLRAYAMFFRIRFIVIRSCVISFILVLLVQLLGWFKDGIDRVYKSRKLLREERAFWNEIAKEDSHVTDEQRFQFIQSVQEDGVHTSVNWTSILNDSYQRKAVRHELTETTDRYKHRFEDEHAPVAQRIFHVFEETKVFTQPKFCSSPQVFHPQCPYKNCRWTCDEPSNNTDGSRRASVFHHTDINATIMEQKLQHRSPKDIWVLWIDEANCTLTQLNQYRFNWTLSFRQDSEVSLGAYGLLIPRSPDQSLPAENLIDDQRFLRLYINRKIRPTHPLIEHRILLNFRYRHKHALWLVSNCSPKRRLRYYTDLKEFFPVRAFGGCVEHKCNRSDTCEYEQAHLALFYLAFESQTCQDYITEKFWRALRFGMIPVVLGPSKQSYLDLGVPSTAFIHTSDFASAEALAEHLHAVATDYFRYRRYFRWLNQYQVLYDTNALEPVRMCELCVRLNVQEFRVHSFYTDVHKWHRRGC